MAGGLLAQPIAAGEWSSDVVTRPVGAADLPNAAATSDENPAAAVLRPVEAVSMGLWVGDSLDERYHPLLLEACLLERGDRTACVNAAGYGVDGVRFLERLEAASGVKWKKMETKSAWSLRDVWGDSAVDSVYWLMANPHLTRRAVPGRRTAIWVPEMEGDEVALAVSEAQQLHRQRLANEPEEIVNYYSVQVKSGDCLSHIARRERVSVREIKAWNNLKSDRIYVGQRLLIGGWPTKSNKT